MWDTPARTGNSPVGRIAPFAYHHGMPFQHDFERFFGLPVPQNETQKGTPDTSHLHPDAKETS
jgi:hypothetical protein